VLEIDDFLEAVRRVGRGGTAIETHVTSIFLKLRLTPAPDDHRRVLAVLAFLRS
jgi:hypothetical protein